MSVSDLASIVGEASSILLASNKRTYLEPLNSNLLKIGLIGAPNVGKSTLYNCLMRNQDQDSTVENTVFTTIDPYLGTFTPRDDRMEFFQQVFPDATSIIPTQCTVIDTAAIVQGSFKDVNLFQFGLSVIRFILAFKSVFFLTEMRCGHVFRRFIV